MLEFEEKWKPPLQGCANPTKKILHRDDIDVSKKHKKTKKIVCPSHDKHLKKNQKQKKSKMSTTSWFFSSPKKKTHTKTLFFLLENEKWRRKRDWKVLKSKVKKFFFKQRIKKQNKVKKQNVKRKKF